MCAVGISTRSPLALDAINLDPVVPGNQDGLRVCGVVGPAHGKADDRVDVLDIKAAEALLSAGVVAAHDCSMSATGEIVAPADSSLSASA